jgi:histidinol dehydrogenase
MGDYIAGPNHILPTQGSARFLSPLGVEEFLKRISIIEMKEEGLRALAPKVITLARAEELPGHGESVRLRLE